MSELLKKLRDDIARGGIKRVLLVRFGRIGENMFWTSVPGAIKAVHPQMEILVLTNRPVLWEDHPGVEEVLSFPPGLTRKSSGKELEPVLRELRQKNLDVVVIGKEPPVIHEMLAKIGVPHLVDPDWHAEAGEAPGIPSTHNGGCAGLYHRAEAAVLDAWPLGIGDPPWPMVLHISEEARRAARELLPPGWEKYVVLNIGTNQTVRSWPLGRHDRTWPVRNFVECVRSLLDVEGLHFLLIAHSPRERRRAKKLAKALPSGTSFFPDKAPGLITLGALMQRSSCLVTCDTGILHMASSLGVSAVGIFGPRARPEVTGPYLLGKRGRVIVSGTRDDMKPASTISGERVAEAVRELLAEDRVE